MEASGNRTKGFGQVLWSSKTLRVIWIIVIPFFFVGDAFMFCGAGWSFSTDDDLWIPLGHSKQNRSASSDKSPGSLEELHRTSTR